MKKLVFLILLFIITLISCDGRDRKYKTNAEVLQESNLLKSFSEEINFIPFEPVEIITDTIMSNGFQIKLKYNSLENSFITKLSKSETEEVINTNYKNFEASIFVLKDEKIIFNETINKELFYEFETPTFWSSAIMQFVWIDYETSTKNSINLNTSFCIPETDVCKDFAINIDTYGNIKIEETNLIAKII